MLGGNQLRGAVQYGQELGTQEFNNAFNRYQTERNARLNPLQSLTGMSQTTANNLSSAGQNYATSAGNAYMDQGLNAANAGLIGSRARASAYGNITGEFGKQLSNYFGGNNSGGNYAFGGSSGAGSYLGSTGDFPSMNIG
jgi:hypothetical protein